MRKIFSHLLVIAFIIALSGSAHAALLTNGGFESDVMASGSVLNLSSLTGWTVQYGNVDLVNAGFAGTIVPEGNQVLDLNGYGPSAISQTFSTIAGNKYTVSFLYSNNPLAGSPNTFMVNLWDGTGSKASLYNAVLPAISANNWLTANFTFTATSTLSGLTFAGFSPGASGAFLDKVDVSPVPVPAAVWLLGSGILGLVGLRKRIGLS